MDLENQKKELVVSLKEYLERFIPGTQKAVKWLQQGEEQKALEAIVDIAEGLEWISEAISLTQELYSSVLETDKINDFLIQLNQALEESDTVLIADILEYEIIPIIEEWNKVINK